MYSAALYTCVGLLYIFHNVMGHVICFIKINKQFIHSRPPSSSLQLATALDWFATVFAHTASFGDGCQVAPDGDRIEPKIEPISEEIKYKLFHFMIEEGDLAVADGDALTRIQVRDIPWRALL